MICECPFLKDFTVETIPHRAMDLDYRYLDDSASPRVIMTCQLPLAEVVTNFFSQLKSRSSGYASFE
jgi:translation factor GUF1, mitochondrial